MIKLFVKNNRWLIWVMSPGLLEIYSSLDYDRIREIYDLTEGR